MSATLSLLGLFNYDNTLFDSLVLPADIDKDVLTRNILIECAEFEVLYPNPSFLKAAIGVWSIKESKVWEKLNNTTKLEYNPISNYDRREEWSDSENENVVDNANRSIQESSDGNGNSVAKVAGYNSGELATSSGSESIVNNSANRTEKDTDNIDRNKTGKRNGRAWGNIGVTTTQQMIEAERNVVMFNIYDYITDSFKQRFCLLIY